jgi:hypothetical protein
MNKHEKFLEFNGQAINILNKDGEYWIPVRPIINALKLTASRSIKRLKNDPILGPACAVLPTQVGQNGQKQRRKMTCLPEKYIYGWVFSLQSPNPDLIEYKRACYDLLFNHFHGAITGRKEVIQERVATDQEIAEAKKALAEVPEFKALRELENKRRMLSRSLNSMDNEVVSQFTLELGKEAQDDH